MARRVFVRQSNGQTAVQYVIDEPLPKQRTINIGLFPPYYGEFGWWIMRHVRFVHSYTCGHKVVACLRGQEPLFPTATEFFYDWENTIPDHLRGDDYDALAIKTKAPVIQEMERRWPTGEIIETQTYGRTLLPVKFELGPIKNVLPKVNIAICPRFREHVPTRNWQFWPSLVDRFISEGLTIGTVGVKESSQHTNSQVKAWKHPLGASAGTLDLLKHCDLYLGSDTGPSHLAALMDLDMIIFAKEIIHTLMVREIKSATLKPIEDLGAAGWDDPRLVFDAVMRFMQRRA